MPRDLKCGFMSSNQTFWNESAANFQNMHCWSSQPVPCTGHIGDSRQNNQIHVMMEIWGPLFTAGPCTPPPPACISLPSPASHTLGLSFWAPGLCSAAAQWAPRLQCSRGHRAGERRASSAPATTPGAQKLLKTEASGPRSTWLWAGQRFVPHGYPVCFPWDIGWEAVLQERRNLGCLPQG